jgi:hypothetical protein
MKIKNENQHPVEYLLPISFRIYNGKLECGFKTVCSEPENTKAACEVFRLAVIRSIVLNELLGWRFNGNDYLVK